MRIGVVGAGRWGINHVRTLHRMKMLAGVAEVDPKIRTSLRREFPDAKSTEHVNEILDGSTDGVVVATPAPTHYEHARRALEAGKDVLVEKPICLRSKEADELVRIAEREKRILMAGHLLAYYPAVRWMKDYVAAGNLGTLWSIHQDRLNLGTIRQVENALWSLGVHDIAVALWLAGSEPSEVACLGHRILRPDVEDDVHLHLGFPSGLRAHLHASWLWPSKSRSMTLIGSKGMLVHDEARSTVTLHDKGARPDLGLRDEGSKDVFTASGEPLEQELGHFADCIRTRRTPLTDGRQGAAVVRILEAADRAMVKR